MLLKADLSLRCRTRLRRLYSYVRRPKRSLRAWY
jgi:hypothetical protein